MQTSQDDSMRKLSEAAQLQTSLQTSHAEAKRARTEVVQLQAAVQTSQDEARRARREVVQLQKAVQTTQAEATRLRTEVLQHQTSVQRSQEEAARLKATVELSQAEAVHARDELSRLRHATASSANPMRNAEGEAGAVGLSDIHRVNEVLEQARARTEDQQQQLEEQQQQLVVAAARTFELEQELASYRGTQHARRASPLAAVRRRLGGGVDDTQHLRVTAAATQELEQARQQVKLLLQHNQELDLRLREEAAEGPASRELRSVLQARTMHRCSSNPLRST